MSNLQRGYLPDGKDRQHPVIDPTVDEIVVATPLGWSNPGVKLWYDTVGLTTAFFPPTVIPPDLIVMPVTDNG